MIRRIAYILPVILGALLALAWLTPSQGNAEPVITITPTATPSLPACAYEDGSGQALCYWDAQTMGNGEGTSLISGDCAPDYVGGQVSSNLCVDIFKEGQAGVDFIGECVGIENTISDSDRKNEGWTITECFKAWNA